MLSRVCEQSLKDKIHQIYHSHDYFLANCSNKSRVRLQKLFISFHQTLTKILSLPVISTLSENHLSSGFGSPTTAHSKIAFSPSATSESVGSFTNLGGEPEATVSSTSVRALLNPSGTETAESEQLLLYLVSHARH